MKRRQSFGAWVAALLIATGVSAGALAPSQSHANSLTYKLNKFKGTQYFFQWDDTVTVELTGYIITDGTIGELGLSDIQAYDFQFKITDKGGTATHAFDNMSNPTWTFLTTALTADHNAIYFNFDTSDIYPNQNFMDVGATGADGAYSYFFLSGPAFAGDLGHFGVSTVNYANTLFVGATLPKSGNQIIASIVRSPTPTPLPLTLPLFVSGLGVFGLLARRRRRKTKATAFAA